MQATRGHGIKQERLKQTKGKVGNQKRSHGGVVNAAVAVGTDISSTGDLGPSMDDGNVAVADVDAASMEVCVQDPAGNAGAENSIVPSVKRTSKFSTNPANPMDLSRQLCGVPAEETARKAAERHSEASELFTF